MMNKELEELGKYGIGHLRALNPWLHIFTVDDDNDDDDDDDDDDDE